jgi:hypothetical protein
VTRDRRDAVSGARDIDSIIELKRLWKADELTEDEFDKYEIYLVKSDDEAESDDDLVIKLVFEGVKICIYQFVGHL